MPESTVFPTAQRAASDAWQADGRAYVAKAGARLSTAAEDAPPEDGRRYSAAAMLQFARAVDRHADADLAACLHRCFAFAPAAFAARAQGARQPVGRVFLLADGAILAWVDAAPAGAPPAGHWGAHSCRRPPCCWALPPGAQQRRAPYCEVTTAAQQRRLYRQQALQIL